jgi:NAD-dependent deacetylase
MKRLLDAFRRKQPAAAPEAPTAPGVVVLTGAGISRASGLRTFRDSDGLWHDVPIWKVASPYGFETDPELVLRFYDERRRDAQAAPPNAAHMALAAFEKSWPGPFLLVTQNVDGLHEAAGCEDVLHVHGSLFRARCTACAWSGPQTGDMWPGDRACPACGAPKRPDVVWFGENPQGVGEALDAANAATIVAVVGCSLEVSPINKMPIAAWQGARPSRVVEINPNPTRHHAFTEVIAEAAEIGVPRFLKTLRAP